MTASALFSRWLFGALVGTLLVAMTSPAFLRNYPSRFFCEERQAVVFAPDEVYRWRREGYASTRIGPMGRVGASSRLDVTEIRVALWGDSQAEGVCVADREKIAHQAELLVREIVEGDPGVSVHCLARSGDQSNHWISQITALARHGVRFDVHAFLVTQSEDWCIEATEPTERLSTLEAFAAKYVPAFVIEAVRNTVTVNGSGTPRRLRWTLGPEKLKSTTKVNDAMELGDEKPLMTQRLFSQLDRLRRAIGTDSETPRVVLLYAPLTPSITGGRLIAKPAQDAFLEALQEAAKRIDAEVVDVSQAMQESVEQGNWPRGFHHGRFGSGHFNATGNRIIARDLARWILRDASK